MINEDRVAPGAGFDRHGHRDMEIISYLLEGSLEHEDSMGNRAVIRPGEVQRMSAGTGVRLGCRTASTMRRGPSPSTSCRSGSSPSARGSPQATSRRRFRPRSGKGHCRLVGSRDGREGSVTIHQDVDLYAGRLAQGEAASFALRPGRQAWLQVARGRLELNGRHLATGDGAAVNGEDELRNKGVDDAELLLFDLAA